MKNRSQVIALFIEKSGSSSHRTVKSMTILLLFRLTAPVKAFGLRSLVKPPPFNEQKLCPLASRFTRETNPIVSQTKFNPIIKKIKRCND